LLGENDMDWRSITDICGIFLLGFSSLILAVIGIKNGKWKYGMFVSNKELSSSDWKVLGLAGLSFLIAFVLFAVGTFSL